MIKSVRKNYDDTLSNLINLSKIITNNKWNKYTDSDVGTALLKFLSMSSVVSSTYLDKYITNMFIHSNSDDVRAIHNLLSTFDIPIRTLSPTSMKVSINLENSYTESITISRGTNFTINGANFCTIDDYFIQPRTVYAELDLYNGEFLAENHTYLSIYDNEIILKGDNICHDYFSMYVDDEKWTLADNAKYLPKGKYYSIKYDSEGNTVVSLPISYDLVILNESVIRFEYLSCNPDNVMIEDNYYNFEIKEVVPNLTESLSFFTLFNESDEIYKSVKLPEDIKYYKVLAKESNDTYTDLSDILSIDKPYITAKSALSSEMICVRFYSSDDDRDEYLFESPLEILDSYTMVEGESQYYYGVIHRDDILRYRSKVFDISLNTNIKHNGEDISSNIKVSDIIEYRFYSSNSDSYTEMLSIPTNLSIFDKIVTREDYENAVNNMKRISIAAAYDCSSSDTHISELLEYRKQGIVNLDVSCSSNLIVVAAPTDGNYLKDSELKQDIYNYLITKGLSEYDINIEIVEPIYKPVSFNIYLKTNTNNQSENTDIANIVNSKVSEYFKLGYIKYGTIIRKDNILSMIGKSDDRILSADLSDDYKDILLTCLELPKLVKINIITGYDKVFAYDDISSSEIVGAREFRLLDNSKQPESCDTIIERGTTDSGSLNSESTSKSINISGEITLDTESVMNSIDIVDSSITYEAFAKTTIVDESGQFASIGYNVIASELALISDSENESLKISYPDTESAELNY